MKRRRVLLGVSTATAGLLAGCFGDSNDPESAMERYYDALEEGDVEAMNELIHPEAPFGRIDEAEFEEYEQLGEGLELDVQEIELVEEGEDEAIVESTVEHDHPELGVETTHDRNTLRTHDGEWLLYEVEVTG